MNNPPIRILHAPGRHCASTAIRDLAHHHGITLTEATCFGIGCGLGIWYFPLDGGSPSRLIHVRSHDIENQFFTRIGHPFSWEQFPAPPDGEAALIAAIDAGRPVIIQSDIYYLPYYNSRTHFPGHDIVAWAYDRDAEVFIVTDTERAEPCTVPFENMRRARYCSIGLFIIQGNQFGPASLAVKGDMNEIVWSAIAHNSRVLIEDSSGLGGIAALHRWRDELPRWHEFTDWQWTARFTYQVIEKRGTGGCGFRAMYADFLREWEDRVPAIRAAGLVPKMQECALAWQGLALEMKRTSENETFYHGPVLEKLERVIERETDYHGAVRESCR